MNDKNVCAFFLFNEMCYIVTILQTPKVTGFRTMTQADVPIAFRLVSEVCTERQNLQSIVRSYLIYGSGTWTTKVEHEAK